MLSGSDVEVDDEDDGLARHVWDKYTNSKTDLTKARERLENISALRKSVSILETNNLTTAPQVTEESKPADKKPLGGKVAVPEDNKSKVLQLRKKPSMDLTGPDRLEQQQEKEWTERIKNTMP